MHPVALKELIEKSVNESAGDNQLLIDGLYSAISKSLYGNKNIAFADCEPMSPQDIADAKHFCLPDSIFANFHGQVLGFPLSNEVCKRLIADHDKFRVALREAWVMYVLSVGGNRKEFCDDHNVTLHDCEMWEIFNDGLEVFLEKCIKLNETSAYCLGCGHDHGETHKQDCVLFGTVWENPDKRVDRLQCLQMIIADYNR